MWKTVCFAICFINYRLFVIDMTRNICLMIDLGKFESKQEQLFSYFLDVTIYSEISISVMAAFYNSGIPVEHDYT